MKKSLIFLSMFTALSMASCGGSDVDTSKIALDYGYDYKNNIIDVSEIEIGYSTLETKIANKESFVLLVFYEGCGCWTRFYPQAITFMNKYNVKFPAIKTSSFDGEPDKFGIYTVDSDMPSVVFFRRGNLIRQTVSGKLKDKSIFEDYKAFEKYMLDNIYLPKMYYLDKDALDDKISEKEEFNLYIARNKCGDCKRVNEDVLYGWSDANKEKDVPSKPLYIFDAQVYYNTDQYQAIKDMYGLSNTEFNPIFGYSTGMFPTFQRWSNGVIIDMITTLNDGIGDNHTLASYFNETRVNASPMLSAYGSKYILDGQALKDSDIGSFVNPTTQEVIEYLKQDAQAEMHNPIVELYLETYVK